MRRLGTTAAALCVALLPLTGAARDEDRMRAPWTSSAPPATRAAHAETRPEIVTAAGLLRLFQKLVSPVDGPRCHLFPTCSEFARRAVRQHGLLVGAVLTAGRLLRDNAAAGNFYRRRRIGGRIVLYDPPEDHWPLRGSRAAKGKRQEARLAEQRPAAGDGAEPEAPATAGGP